MVILLRPTVPVRWRVFGATVAGLLAITLWLRGTAPPPAAPPPPAPPPRSIAVMPFINASPDSSYDYLGRGLAGDLTSTLGRVPGLRVTAEPSAAALAGDDPVTVGRRLRVGSVLVGSIRPVGGRLRVSAHLVSVGGGFDIWSEAYERPQASFLRVESDIAGAVAAALQLRGGTVKSLGEVPLFRASPEVHDAYLKGRFDEAIALDSLYAPAWAGLAQANLREFLSETASPEDAIPPARRAAERAIALDSGGAEVRIVRAVIWLLYDREQAKAAAELRRALALNPSLAEGHQWEARRLLAADQEDSARAAARRAIDSSPFDTTLRAQVGWPYLLLGEDSVAADSGAAYDSLVAAARERYVSPYTLAVAAVAASRTREALAALARAIAERTPWVSYARLDPRLGALHGNGRFEALLARLRQTTIPTRP